MKHTRERMARELRARLAEIFAKRVADPRLRGLAIAEVRPSPDLGFARVFYVDREDLSEPIERAKPFVRRCLAHGLRTRRVPELDFRRDPSPDEARRIDELLGEPPSAGAAGAGTPEGDGR